MIAGLVVEDFRVAMVVRGKIEKVDEETGQPQTSLMADRVQDVGPGTERIPCDLPSPARVVTAKRSAGGITVVAGAVDIVGEEGNVGRPPRTGQRVF